MTGLAWQVSDIADLRAGMYSVTGGDVLQMYVVVDANPSSCNNGVLSANEICDRANLNGATCESLGYPNGGTLKCSGRCEYDTSACAHGNGIIEGNEVCDGTNLNGATCESLGYQYGTLQCNSNCNGYDTNYCSSCGDGKVLAPYEECDIFSGQRSCSLFGYTGGIVLCTDQCTNDVSRCFTSQCNDNEIVGNQTVSSPIIKGTVTGVTSYGIPFSLDDYCTTETSILDFHCDTSKEAGQSYTVTDCTTLGYTACANGACY